VEHLAQRALGRPRCVVSWSSPSTLLVARWSH
jgi:hypothetical protein